MASSSGTQYTPAEMANQSDINLSEHMLPAKKTDHLSDLLWYPTLGHKISNAYVSLNLIKLD